MSEQKLDVPLKLFLSVILLKQLPYHLLAMQQRSTIVLEKLGSELPRPQPMEGLYNHHR